MCGICGTTQADDGRVLSAMNAAMRHRGPDDEGIYLDARANVGLGARRLSIIDVAGGHQPLTNEKGTVCAVLNGEIYNFQLLRRTLIEAGHRFSTQTDTEVLVHLYEQYGVELVHALEGMYAFAIWDAEKGLLLIGRDRFGEKPLFYTRSGGGALTFASELTALARGIRSGCELAPAAVDTYFTYGYISAPESILRDVIQLPPAHILVWNRASRSLTTRSYWSPPRMAQTANAPLPELISETRQLLEASVRSRLIADVPLGVFLSGGIDSTLVAALAAANSREPIQTFTVGYNSGRVDETAPARRSATLIGAHHHELILTDADVAALVPQALADLDQPLADQAFVALRALTEFARREVKVAVGGEGADELFGGYGRYRWLARSEHIARWMPSVVARRAAELLERPELGRASRLANVVRPQPTLDRHVSWVTDGRGAHRHALYGPRLRAYVNRNSVGYAVKEVVDAAGKEAVEGRFMALDRLQWLPNDVLVKADRASMQASLELRTPYLSRELAEFAVGIPATTHVRGGGKLLLRRVLHELIPESAHHRPKLAFRVPSPQWLRGPLAGTLSEQLQGSALFAEGWLDRQAVARLAEEHWGGRRDWAHVLWPIFALGSWLDRFVGKS